MRKKPIVIALLVVLVNITFLCFWKSNQAKAIEKVASPVVRNKVSASLSPKFNPKEIVKQYPFSGDPPNLNHVPKIHQSTSPTLEGEINNKYKIRDDILKQIEEMTVNNEKARRAAIKFAYYDNLIYYHSHTSEEALAWDRKLALAGWCLVLADHDKWLSIQDKYSGLMKNTTDRRQHIQKLDSKFFAWKLLGDGLTQDEEDERCRAENY